MPTTMIWKHFGPQADVTIQAEDCDAAINFTGTLTLLLMCFQIPMSFIFKLSFTQ
jgi:hypothetical protein